MTARLAPLPHERRDSGYTRASGAKAPGFAPVFGPRVVPVLSGNRGRESGTAKPRTR